MKLSRKTVVGLVAALVLTAVATLWGPDAVSLVRDAVQTAPVTTQTEGDTAPVVTGQ